MIDDVIPSANGRADVNNHTANFTIMIVDDLDDNLFTLRTLIHRYVTVNVIEASSGKMALDLALQQVVDIIILDVQMPDMDGFQTASMLKIRKRTKDIPIIFLTAAFKAHEFQQKGYKVGAVDYLLKPIDDNLLINKISTYIRLIENERHTNILLEKKVRERTDELHRAKNYVEGILAFMGEALIVLKTNGVIEYVNPATLEMLDYAAHDLIGMSIGDIFEEEDEQKARAFFGTWLEAIIRTGVIKNIDASFIARNGSRIPILFSRSAIKEADGNLTGIICVAKNMTGYTKVKE